MLTTAINSKHTQSNELNSAIIEAMKKTGVQKETDLCLYIPHGDTHLAPALFSQLKENSKQQLRELIQIHILDNPPKKIPSQQPVKHSPRSIQLEDIIKKAMHKVKLKKESHLCRYIPYENGRLHHFTFQNLKQNAPEKLIDLIQDHMLSKDPKKQPRHYKKRFKEETTSNSDDSLEQTIAKALKRSSLKLENEKDICKYIPNGDRFLHPMSFYKMKKKDPNGLKEMIQKFVIDPRKPKLLSWNQKQKSVPQDSNEHDPSLATRHNNKSEPAKIDVLLESTSKSLELMAEILKFFQDQKHDELNRISPQTKSVGDEKMPDSFPERYLRTIQNQLIKQIRQKQVDVELWDTYVELVELA